MGSTYRHVILLIESLLDISIEQAALARPRLASEYQLEHRFGRTGHTSSTLHNCDIYYSVSVHYQQLV